MRDLLSFLARDFGQVSLKPLSTRSFPMRRRFFALILLACAVPATVLAGSHYYYTNFDVPGSTQTRCLDINHAGQIGGDFLDANGVNHGFQWIGGVFTQFDVPGSVYTGISAVNTSGVAVGRYDFPAFNDAHGFIYSGGNYTTFDVPGATFTAAWGINDAGQVIGRYLTADGVSHGFLLSGGVFTTIDFPNAISTGTYGINNNGQIVGSYDDAAGKTHAFLLSGGRFTTINYPNVVRNHRLEDQPVRADGRSLPDGRRRLPRLLAQQRHSTRRSTSPTPPTPRPTGSTTSVRSWGDTTTPRGLTASTP